LRAAFLSTLGTLVLCGCSLPSLEDSPNALSAPPPSAMQAAKSSEPPASMPSPETVASTLPATETGPDPDLSAAVPPEKSQGKSSKLEVESKTAVTDLPADASDETGAPENEFKEGGIDAVFTPYGVEVSLGDGNMCVSDMPGTSGKLKAGQVMQIACSDDRTGQVKINRLIDGKRAEASLRLGAAGARNIVVAIE
jgi:hypothetical protein